MSQITIEKVHDKKAGTPALLERAGDVVENVRQRAYELSTSRTPDEDWLQAERELFGTPSSKLSEKDGKLHLAVAVPGFDAKDVRVVVAENELVVEAESSHRDVHEEGNVYFSEFDGQSFFRSFPLPALVNVDRVTAHLEKGILHVTAPRREPANIHIAAA